jgi:hypothetical protein
VKRGQDLPHIRAKTALGVYLVGRRVSINEKGGRENVPGEMKCSEISDAFSVLSDYGRYQVKIDSILLVIE